MAVTFATQTEARNIVDRLTRPDSLTFELAAATRLREIVFDDWRLKPKAEGFCIVTLPSINNSVQGFAAGVGNINLDNTEKPRILTLGLKDYVHCGVWSLGAVEEGAKRTAISIMPRFFETRKSEDVEWFAIQYNSKGMATQMNQFRFVVLHLTNPFTKRRTKLSIARSKKFKRPASMVPV